MRTRQRFRFSLSPFHLARTRWFPGGMALLLLVASGCHPIQPHYLHEDGDLSHYLDVATDIEYPDVNLDTLPEVKGTRAPVTITNPDFENWWDLSLEEAISAALHNSKVIRDEGAFRQFGQVLANSPSRIAANPDSVSTIYDVAIQESSQSGAEQVLSNFDAVFNSTVTWDSSDRAQNFLAAQVNAAVLQSDQVSINNELSKLTVSGAQWFFRHTANYDGANNDLTAGTRRVPSSWNTALETEVRQPLLRGRGAQINRIPVVLARMRTDTALADFQDAIQNLLNSVEYSYWQLYFQYRNLDANRQGRDSALAAWQKVDGQSREPGGSADRVAQAKGQYYFFEGRVKQALSELQIAEARLRLFMGLTSSDGRFIRPTDEPSTAKVNFDWHEIQAEALLFSNELRRQQWQIKQRELELIAAKNQLLPQIDAVGLYRWVGVGDEYNSSGQNGARFPTDGSTAIDSLLRGEFQEFRLGLSSEIPIGFRRPLAQLRNQQLQLARAHAKYQESELEITHSLDDATKRLVANYEILQANLQRRIATATQVEAAEVGLEQSSVDLLSLLQAQNARTDADIAYFQNLVEYNEAIVEIHRVKGSLLAYNNVILAEGPWPEKAYFDAHNLARQRDASYYLDYGYTRPRVVSRGPLDQQRAVTIGDDQESGTRTSTDSSAPIEDSDLTPQAEEAGSLDSGSDEPPLPDEELPLPSLSETDASTMVEPPSAALGETDSTGVERMTEPSPMAPSTASPESAAPDSVAPEIDDMVAELSAPDAAVEVAQPPVIERKSPLPRSTSSQGSSRSSIRFRESPTR